MRFMNEKFYKLIGISLKFVPTGSTDSIGPGNIQAITWTNAAHIIGGRLDN